MSGASVGAMYGRTGRSHAVAAILMWLAMFLADATGFAKASDAANMASETGVLCTAAWYQSIEEKVPTGDGRGHGPDVGSDEWKSVVEFKLGIRCQDQIA